VLDAIRAAANDSGNSRCGKSYVHETVVKAFEEGALEQFANMSRGPGSASRSEKVLAEVTDQIATDFAA
jgi:DNA topoisomerase I